MKGLVIDEPWVSMILDGSKTWEMSTGPIAIRGEIALIKKGSGNVVGVTKLTDSHGPLGYKELEANALKHQVPLELFRSGQASKWTTAWVLASTRRLRQPVPYKHPFGAVIWVNLDAGTTTAILAQVQGRQVEIVRPPDRPNTADSGNGEGKTQPGALVRVPVAKDGSWFGPHLLRAGQFTVGEKGEELRLDTFDKALAALTRMSVPRWRRPNAKGNWGIVSGVRWERLKDCTR